MRDGADGAVPGLAVTDTLKRVDDVRVTATVDRVGLVAVQTPQAFRADILRERTRALTTRPTTPRWSKRSVARVVVVPGDPRNLKVTGPADLDDRRRPARDVVSHGSGSGTTSTRSATTTPVGSCSVA